MFTSDNQPANRGRKPGSQTIKQLQKAAVQDELRQRVMKNADKLFNAQFAQAVGSIQIFEVIEHKNSKGNVIRIEHKLVTDAETIKQVLDTGEGVNCSVDGGFYLVTHIMPENRAIDSMLDRTFGKAQQSIEVKNEGLTRTLELLETLIQSKLAADKREAIQVCRELEYAIPEDVERQILASDMEM